jgi:leucyl aminopeptidase
VVGLGEYAGGLFTNDDKLAEDLFAIGNRTFERVWRLPILPEHNSELDNPSADIASTGSGRTGGAWCVVLLVCKAQVTRWPS